MPEEIIRIGVLSDTHTDELSETFRRTLTQRFVGCSAIIHAGDVTRMAVLDALEALGFAVWGVRGNMDGHPEMRSLPAKRTMTLGTVRVGVCHGWGAPDGIRRRILESFRPDPPSVIIYGHTHEAADVTECGVRFLNPGSATRPRFGRPSLGLLSVVDRTLYFEIISF